MSCPTHEKKFKIGETFTAPKVVISSSTATESQYVDCTVDFRMVHTILGTVVAADTIHKTVGFGAINVSDAYGGSTVTPEQWVLQLIAIVNFAHTNIPEGEYHMRYEVTFPGGVKKFYGELIVCFEL